MNIARFAVENIGKFGVYNQLTFIGNEETVVLTNEEIEKRARTLAAGLKKMGIKKGDVVAVVLTNVPELFQTLNGIVRTGAIFLPVIFALTALEIRHLIEHSESKYLITEKRLLPKIREALADLTAQPKLIVIGATPEDDCINYADLLTESDFRGDVQDVSDDDLAILMYTSGTTGFPKGVMLSHGNLENNLRQGAEIWTPQPGSLGLVCLPMNHTFGLSSYTQSCLFGDGIVMLTKFDPEKIFAALKDYPIKSLPLVPTMITMLMQAYDPKKHNLGKLSAIISSGSPLAEATLIKAMELFKVPIFHGYGLTEAGPTVARQRVDRYKFGSVGPALPRLELKIIDEGNNEVPTGTEGEIICKGPGIMKGYWKMPEETAAALKNGWLYTGDIGKLDEDGDLYITGRKKDLIIKGGENIDPGISEKWLYYHPAVSEAAVIGIPDAKYGEEVAAAIVLKPGQKVSEQEIIDYLRQHMHHFMAPNKIFFIDEMPKSNLGKILKKDLRKNLAGT